MLRESGDHDATRCKILGGEGAAALFAHANAYPPDSYRRMLAPLLARHRVEAIRFRPLWQPFESRADMAGWRVLVRDLLTTVETRFDEPVCAVGHSMGGVATLFAAVERPELFRCIALIDPVFLPLSHVAVMRLTPPALRGRFRIVRKARQRPHHWPDRQAAFDFHRRTRAFARMPDPALWDFIEAGTQTSDGGVELAYSGAWEAEVYATVPYVWHALRRCRVPMMGVRGSESTVIDARAWRRWRRLQPRGTFVEIAGSGHLAPLEKPLETGEAVARFFAANP